MSESINDVQSKNVRIRFDSNKCIHSRACILSRPDVFVPNVKGAWIHPELATPEEIADAVAQIKAGTTVPEDFLDNQPVTKSAPPEIVPVLPERKK